MTPVEKAQKIYREMVRDGKVPTPEEKFRKHPTPLKAIRLFCIDCQGGTRRGPASCESRTCPLWAFRKGKKERGGIK